MPLPHFDDVTQTIISFLREREGSANTADISRALIARFRISAASATARAPSGESAWKARLRNIKSSLLKKGILKADAPGLWTLNE